MIRWNAESVLLVFGSQGQCELLHLVVTRVWRSALCLRFHKKEILQMTCETN